jgi:hypothetical protein
MHRENFFKGRHGCGEKFRWWLNYSAIESLKASGVWIPFLWKPGISPGACRGRMRKRNPPPGLGAGASERCGTLKVFVQGVSFGNVERIEKGI